MIDVGDPFSLCTVSPLYKWLWPAEQQVSSIYPLSLSEFLSWLSQWKIVAEKCKLLNCFFPKLVLLSQCSITTTEKKLDRNVFRIPSRYFWDRPDHVILWEVLDIWVGKALECLDRMELFCRSEETRWEAWLTTF